MLKIGILNITSYSGMELMRILTNHPEVEVMQVTGRSQAGKTLGEVFPFYNGKLKITESLQEDVDLIFSALPHKASAEIIGQYVNNDIPVIDFSADFRLPIDIYENIYDVKHPYPSLINKFIYGLPEKNKEEIKSSKFIANPGCFPTCATIPLLPLENINISNIIVDAKTGISGAGRSQNINHSFSEISDNISAYSIKGHRHEPEIENNINKNVYLTTQLSSITRGIFSTIYFQSEDKIDIENYKHHFDGMPFANVYSEPPRVKEVRGTNNCNIFIQELPKKSNINNYRIISVIDNLVKGAAGQAVQNMNIMFSFDETLGLNNMALYP
jgi:N-acetyl-gamma-glutamyl-phosphate reductase